MIRPALLAVLLLSLVAPAARATPREELLRLVPDDVGFCLVLSDLRGQHDKLARSPWLKAADKLPLGKALRDAPALAKLARLDEPLRRSLGVTWEQLRDDVLGDAVVMAFKPGGPQAPDRGIILLHARDRDLLARLLARLNDEQKKSGDLKELQERKHRGFTYHRRAEAKGESFYHLDGALLAWTADEGLLRQVLDRRADTKKALKSIPLVDQAKQAGTETAVATIWINPRALDDELEQQAGAAIGNEAHAFKTFLSYWKALDGVSVSLRVGDEPEIVLGLHAQTDALPAAAQRLVKQTAAASDLWGRFPKDALMALACRADLATMTEVLNEFLPPEQRKPFSDGVRQSLGMPMGEAFLKQVLPQLGPDWGVCVLPPADDKGPPLTLFALRVRPGSGKVDQAILSTVQLLIGFAILDHNLKNKDSVQIRKSVQDGVDVYYLAGGKALPRGVRPSLALKGGYLLLANSPEAIRRFAAKPEPVQADGAPLLRLSLRQMAKLFKERPDQMPGLLNFGKGLPQHQAREVLAGLVGALELFDSVELSQRGGGERITWAVRLRAAVAP